MPTKTGAGGAQQEYDESTGRYGGGDGKSKEYRQNTEYKDLTKFFESGTIKSKKQLVYDTPETREFYDRVKSGNYYTMEELKDHPVVKYLDTLSAELSAKYGDTSKIKFFLLPSDREHEFLKVEIQAKEGS